MLNVAVTVVGAAADLDALQLTLLPPLEPDQAQLVEPPVVGKLGPVGLAVPTEQKVYEPQPVSVAR